MNFLTDSGPSRGIVLSPGLLGRPRTAPYGPLGRGNAVRNAKGGAHLAVAARGSGEQPQVRSLCP
jgi:hypothetical protein